jgi:hypothetical protein
MQSQEDTFKKDYKATEYTGVRSYSVAGKKGYYGIQDESMFVGVISNEFYRDR